MARVLFSPIGGTDPISNCRDGAMLHICRVYKSDMLKEYVQLLNRGIKESYWDSYDTMNQLIIELIKRR